MDREQLLGLYASRPAVISMRSGIGEAGSQRIHLNGLIGSSQSMIISAVSMNDTHSHIIVLNDADEAAYLLNDIENLLTNEQVYFFPSSYKKPFETEDTDNGNVLMRAEVLSKLNRNSKTIVVTHAEALAEKVVTRKNLENNSIALRVGETVSVSFINEFLLHHEFENVDFVAQAGEYSIRGGIVDIYSFANELPYRIEFFGDEVESIRTFDPTTQLSVQPMNHVAIMPNVQKKLLEEGRSSFLDFVSPDTVFWFDDLNGADAFLRHHLFKPETEIMQEKLYELYDAPVVFLKKLGEKQVIEFGKRKFFPSDKSFDFNISPQPSFNKNFPLLITNLQGNQRNKIKNIIFADTARQIERLYAIFEDLEKKHAIENKVDFTSLLLSLHEGFIDHDLKLACYTDHQIFDRYHRYRLKKKHSRTEAMTLKELSSLKPGDYVTHIDHGVGRFAGLEHIMVNGKPQEAIRLIYKDNDILYVSIHALHRIAKYTGKEGTAPALHKLGSTTWATLKQKTKKKVKDIAKDLIALYAKRRATKGFAFSPDTYLQNELEASFIYEDTPDQIKSTRDVKKDMEKEYPMDRLICGDVGFGKTEIAIRAAFKAVTDGKQVAVLVPTTILALQHYNTFKDRLRDFPCTVDFINRFKSAARQKETLQKLGEGKIDIIIGTHRLLGKDIKFKDLGLMVIDEEQKFGVAAKEKLKAIRVNVDTLTLTATPIPRTLQFSLMGARDLSIINTPPPNRYPVTTELHVFSEKLIKDAINYELARGGQVFFVHNKVQDIHDISALISRLCPQARISVGHGQMDGDKLEEVLMTFIDGESDVLVATTIIESGIDIPNANTIIINQAQHFGLSDLHQMRGRVGRSNKRAYCYLLSPPLSVLTNEAKQRLKAIEEFSDLGSGFNVAMRDLDIRGAGNLLGGEQSGFISEIGFEMYHKILDEAISELKETEFADVFVAEREERKYVTDCQIDTDLEILLPSDYVNSVSERLLLYKELDSLEIEEKLVEFEERLRDRFGPLPRPAVELLSTIRLRWIAEKTGFEKILLKNKRFIGYFVSNPASPFYQSETFSGILKYVQRNSSKLRLKEDKGKLSLTLKDVETVDDARKALQVILENN
jgi:transcription-repair coupling factor (superfamily II helicase)